MENSLVRYGAKAAIAVWTGYPPMWPTAATLNLFDPERHNCLRCMISPGPISPNDSSVKIPTVAANVYHIAHNRRGPLKIVLIATKLLLGHKIS